MAPRLPRPDLKLPKIPQLGRKKEEPAPTPEAAAPPPAGEGRPGVRFVPLEWRPAEARPAPRAAPDVPADAPTEVALPEETAREAPPAPEPVAEPVPEPAPEPPRPRTEVGPHGRTRGNLLPTVAEQPIERVEGIGPSYGEKLRAAGIVIIEDLVLADPEDVARRTGISLVLVRKWHDMGRLQAVHGVGPQYSELLVRAGVRTMDDLAEQSPATLAERLNAYNDSLGARVEGNPITEAMAEDWVRQARDLAAGRAPALAVPEAAAEPAPAPEPPAAPLHADVPPPPATRFGLPFGRKRATPAPEPAAEATPVTPTKFSLGFGKRKDSPAPAEAAPPEPAPAEATKPARKLGFSFGKKAAPAAVEPAAAPGPEVEAAPKPGRKLGFSFGKTKEQPEAAPKAPRKLGFTIGKKKDAPAPEAKPAPPAAEPAEVPAPEPVAALAPSLPEPVAPAALAEPAAVASPPPTPAGGVTLTLPVAEDGPAPAREPTLRLPAAATPPRPDFEYLHLRVDRVLSDRSVYRMPRPAERREIDDQVDQLLGAKLGKGKARGRKKA